MACGVPSCFKFGTLDLDKAVISFAPSLRRGGFQDCWIPERRPRQAPASTRQTEAERAAPPFPSGRGQLTPRSPVCGRGTAKSETLARTRMRRCRQRERSPFGQKEGESVQNCFAEHTGPQRAPRCPATPQSIALVRTMHHIENRRLRTRDPSNEGNSDEISGGR